MKLQGQICTRCIYDATVPGVSFDEQGECNYCKMSDSVASQFKTGSQEGADELQNILNKIKGAGRNKKYDCVIGVSGGTDSSYLLAKAVEWGLRPLAVHYDNTWNSAIATENIRKMTSMLDVDLYTLVVDNKEADDIFRAFFRANVPELDSSTDIALAETLYRAADKYNIKYVLEGHSFMTEGISPMGNNYFDGKYIKDVHAKFGKRKMKTFPNMSFVSFLKWIVLKRIKKIRPYWYIDYSKEEARKYLAEKFDWQYYGGHHLENRLTAFLHKIYNPKKFNIDNRNWSLAASVRNGTLERDEAIRIYNTAVAHDHDLEAYFKKRLELTDAEYDQVMTGEKKTYKHYNTYKKRFENLRPLFYILAKANLVPMSFYIKYTSPTEG